jgi:hypothetical protein
MKDAVQNPFNITKAVDFTDQEINDYWVDIPSGAGFLDMAKPTSPMPMLILGGKGSGKTHLMRYFSYPLQKIRHSRDVIGGIQKEKYLGVYLRCGGLNSARFKDKGQSEEVWSDIFAYYMELWLSQLLLSTIISAVGKTPDLEDREAEMVAELAQLIHLGNLSLPPPTTLLELNSLLRRLQQELDSAVNNSAITRTLPVRVAVNRGDFIFGIPRALTANFPSLRDCLFLYLIDEFENLSEVQQKYVNTLLRERQSPCSFKIGARMYGIRTYSTYSADEDNKEGSEFEVLRLDAALRENEQYAEFAKRLIAKRLAEFNRVPSDQTTLNAMASTLDEWFEETPKSKFSASETAYVIEKYRGKERPYFKRLRQQIEQAIRSETIVGLNNPADIDRIVNFLSCSEFPLLEKVNLFLFYKEWSSRHDLMQAAEAIEEQCRTHMGGIAENTRYQRILSHFKADLLAQLYRETDQKQRYVGLSTFIEISSGLPRNLLILLKNTFEWAIFNGERPFRDKPISIRSQQAGVLEAAEWFYRNARMIGRDGQLVMDAINRLGTLFRGIRFSEKPSECSCSTFSADVSRSSEIARRVLDVAEKWSLLVDVGGQRDRNTERIDAKIQLNRMLAPRWDLSIYRRGVLALTPAELNAVFDPDHAAEFDMLADRRVARMTAPSFGQQASENDEEDLGSDEPSLFS